MAGIGHDIAHGLKEVCDIDVVTPETGLQRAGEEMGRGDDPGREDRRITMEPLDPRGILSQRISALLRDSCGINTMFFFLFFLVLVFIGGTRLKATVLTCSYLPANMMFVVLQVAEGRTKR